jgi:hypothetical protein
LAFWDFKSQKANLNLLKRKIKINTMKSLRSYCCSIILLFISSNFLWSQRLTNGTIEIGLGIYQYDVVKRQPNQTVSLQGNGILHLGAIEIPLSIRFSNPNIGFQYQPLNRIKFSPTYKGDQLVARLHLGWHSMIFSPYSLAGREFLGIGGELRVAHKWTIQGGIGRIQKSINGVVVEGDPFAAQRPTLFPAFERILQAIHAEWRTKNRYYGISWVHAGDKADDRFVPEADTGIVKRTYHIQPGASSTLECYFKQPLNRSWTIEARFAGTAYTRNTEAALLDTIPAIATTVGLLRFVNQLLPLRTSTQLFGARDVKLEWRTRLKRAPLLMRYRYKRIDPDYKTLVASYLQNDMEQHLFQGEWAGAWNIRSSLGLQHNNLHQNKSSKSQKIIGDLLMSYDATQLGIYQQLSWNYAQINQLPSFYKMRDLIRKEDVLVEVKNRDTASYTSNSTQYNFQWVMPNPKRVKQSVNAFINYTTYQSERREHIVTQDNQVRNFTTNVDYQVSLADKHPIGMALTYERNQTKKEPLTQSWGCSPHSEFHLMDDKLLLNLNYAIFFNYAEAQKDGIAQKVSLWAKYAIPTTQKRTYKQTLVLKADYIKNTASRQLPTTFSELYIHFRYGINF